MVLYPNQLPLSLSRARVIRDALQMWIGKHAVPALEDTIELHQARELLTVLNRYIDRRS